MPGIALNAEDTAMSKTVKALLSEDYILVIRKKNNKHMPTKVMKIFSDNENKLMG